MSASPSLRDDLPLALLDSWRERFVNRNVGSR
jgi:hypothetical protein